MQSGTKRDLEEILSKHSKVFEESLGTLTSKDTFKPRNHTKVLQSKINCLRISCPSKKGLERLVASKIIKPVQYADWAAQIVCIKKDEGKICVFAVILNAQ